MHLLRTRPIVIAFRLYDLRQIGFIKREELKMMILALLHESDLILTDDYVEAIVDKTLFESDLNNDGKINRQEWDKLVKQYPALLKNIFELYILPEKHLEFRHTSGYDFFGKF
ncbi:Calcineurin B-like protein 7 [Bienertia sinuspersici]